MEDVDMVLRVYHKGITSGEMAVGDSKILDRLLEKHREESTGPRGRSPPSITA